MIVFILWKNKNIYKYAWIEWESSIEYALSKKDFKDGRCDFTFRSTKRENLITGKGVCLGWDAMLDLN